MTLSPNKVEWPRRAVVTVGMPYGNKTLHFGHIAGVFVPADCFSRFLRDRIGSENVRLISGTDCYGSPINEGYRKALEAGTFSGSIADYVTMNHELQKATLEKYYIDMTIFEGSGIGVSGEVHQQVSNAFIEKLHANDHLQLKSTLQFYDVEADTFLNGRQVEGRCPVQGCKSEEAYADECSLGHQYAPEDLIAPKSTLTQTVPEMRPVGNWYFDLPNFAGFLKDHVAQLEQDPEVRPVVYNTIKEFLVPPVIYIKTEFYDDYCQLKNDLPDHVYREAEKGKHSFEIEFSSIEARDVARGVLGAAGIRFRTGKALVPFRISGNIEWGVKVPVIDGVEGLTVWCWPESLWAPISFTMAAHKKMGLPEGAWRDFWCAEDSQVYQFIGQDNLYFYGVVQPPLFEALRPGDMCGNEGNGLKQTKLIANYHILYGDKKASSTHNPPSADELLEHYTPEQLRAHFLALGLGLKSVGFKPKPFEPDEEKRNDSRVADPVLKESALLTNVFNRLARSCFYEAQKNFESHMPLDLNVSSQVIEEAHKVMAEYEQVMHRAELHSVMTIMDEYIRAANKRWVSGINEVEAGNEDMRAQVLVDSFFELRICTLLMHPVVPKGTEKICEYLAFDLAIFFSWESDFTNMQDLCTPEEIAQGYHTTKELPPRTDFFEKHPSQYK